MGRVIIDALAITANGCAMILNGYLMRNFLEAPIAGWICTILGFAVVSFGLVGIPVIIYMLHEQSAGRSAGNDG